ncbi:MAG: phosphoethanolamine transferase, partial [Alphaproteobacteria bacterium]|nr:phosphoethanolamine transferase [Alphaproteobacteria bacterium]
FSGTLISYDFMAAIFNTDHKEAFYCLKDYAFFIIVNICIVIVAFLMKEKVPPNKKYARYSAILFVVSIYSANFLSFNMIKLSWRMHMADVQEAKLFSEKYDPLLDIKNTTKSKKQTCVVVIGESVDRNHMGIYGYDRQTTPYFNGMKNELMIFRNVRTAYCFTHLAVKSIFHLKVANKKHYTLINFFKDAGFKTFWFSNQAGWNIFDNSAEYLGKSCDQSVFINKKDTPTPFDIELLTPFKEALADNFDKKLIILHLMGSHSPMEYRYPANFAKFSVHKGHNYVKKNYNTCLYDNSILYTDYILNEIIKLLKEKNENICFLYLSDHGQEICGDDEYVTVTRAGIGTYEVPFIVWLSDKYRQENADFIDNWDINTKYITDKTAYSIIDLARMKHPSIDLSNSVFSRRNGIR